MQAPVVILNDTSVDRHHGCARVMRTLLSLCESNGFHVICRAPAHSDWRNNSDVLRAIERATLIIVNGEGTLHHDRPQAHWLLDVAAHARALGKPAVLLNASWAANGSAAEQKLNDFAIVAMRESTSCNAARSADRNLRLTGDLSLYFPHAPSKERAGIVFTDSVLWESTLQLEQLRQRHGGALLSMFDLARSPLDGLRHVRAAVSRTSTGTLGARWRAVEHCIAERAYMARTDSEAIDRVAAASLVITGRFHALCFALLTRTPFLCVETNTHKMHGIVTDCGAERWREVSVEDVDVELVGRASTLSPREVDAIGGYLGEVRASIDQLFVDMRALC